MDLIHKLMNILLPPITFIALLSVLPPYFLLKFLAYIKRQLLSTENMVGKVVVVTGAASGIGEQIAYEYAKRGASLAVVDVREDRLGPVADGARRLGSPDVISLQADVSVVDDCNRFVNAAVNHFGRLDHLVNNAGIARHSLFKNMDCVSDFTPIMDVNFWGTVYGTHFAIPHLRKSKGKIIVVASTCGCYPLPRLAIYNASKAALISFCETLRTEVGSDIGITIVTPGLIKSEMTLTGSLPRGVAFISMESKEECAKAIVRSACRGDNYLVEPSWVRVLFLWKHLAYEYARRGACLALVARREHLLREVATRAELIGSPNAIVIPGDVSKVEDCKHFVDATVTHFGRLDHLVTNAGVAPLSMFEDYPDIRKAVPAVDINFWGSAYSTYFAIPHLKQSKGKIIAIASAGAWLPTPRLSLYNASKAAVIALYETLRVEVGGKVGITIVTPGLIESEMNGGKFLNQAGKLEVDEEMKNVQISLMPLQSTEDCVEAIVNSACRGDKYLTQPSWVGVTYFLKVVWPEMIEWLNRILLISGPGTSQRDTLSKKIFDIAYGIKEFLTPDTFPFDELKIRLDYQKYRRY